MVRSLLVPQLGTKLDLDGCSFKLFPLWIGDYPPPLLAKFSPTQKKFNPYSEQFSMLILDDFWKKKRFFSHIRFPNQLLLRFDNFLLQNILKILEAALFSKKMLKIDDPSWQHKQIRRILQAPLRESHQNASICT